MLFATRVPFVYTVGMKVVPRIAVVSFPGNNCEVESIRAVRQAGMVPVFFRWNDDHAKLQDVDGYFIPGGFSYEDRGRAGMVAARDPLLQWIIEEAERGKVVIGNCNGAQILVESGLVPLDHHLKMSLARNVVNDEAVGFINEWVWITPSCERDRCATSDWSGVMHVPIAHGEGRFTTKDKDVFAELKKNHQIAFSYCDEQGNISEDPVVTPNGSAFAIAGICNPAGNVVALMPHPERTPLGAEYFASMKRWIESGKKGSASKGVRSEEGTALSTRAPQGTEIFIETIIVNNEERTVEQAAKRVAPTAKIKQYRYVMTSQNPAEVLRTISFFNPNKERAYIRRGSTYARWNAEQKKEEPLEESLLSKGISVLRRDEPDTGAHSLGKGSETGICYLLAGIDQKQMNAKELQEVLGNPHASSLAILK